MGEFQIKWTDYGEEPKCQANPAYPKGKDIVAVQNEAAAKCKIALPYPAKRIGMYNIDCKTCGLKLNVTTAGRVDDPRSVLVNCKNNEA